VRREIQQEEVSSGNKGKENWYGTEQERAKGGNYGIINLATHDSELI
jgi:hypothetical protein